MENEQIFAAHLLEVKTALKSSLARYEKAASQGDLDAMEAERERQENLLNVRNQLEVLQELWPQLVAQPELINQPRETAPEHHTLRVKFWTQLLGRAAVHSSLHAHIAPSKRPWIGTEVDKRGLGLNYFLHAHEAHVELYIDCGRKRVNKQIFEQLQAKKGQIEAVFGAPLEWQRIDDGRASRIRYVIPGGGLRDRERWPEIQERMIEAMVRLERALRPHVERL